MAHIFQKTVSTPLSDQRSIKEQESSLTSWASSLPVGLQFNDTNLSAARNKIAGLGHSDNDSRIKTGGDHAEGGQTGHLFAGIHMAAEVRELPKVHKGVISDVLDLVSWRQVAMFFHLQAVKKSSSEMTVSKEEYLSRRQAQAIENIVLVLEAVGEKGRKNPSCEF